YLQPQGATYDGPVRPDKARPQVAFPQTLMSTSAGVAALAQVGTSPAMKAQLPDLARRSLAAAQKGFAYLDKIIAERGAAGTSQHVGRNGETYDGLDALAWATVELFLATGDKALQERLVKTFDPGLTHWGWQRLPEANARAVRSYAFAARSGRRKLEELDPALLARCEKELRAQGADFAAWARSSAYGTPLPSEARRLRRLGWYFSSASAFDLSVAALLDDKPELSEAIDGAFDYELGENPLDVTFVTGLGWKREHVVVSQFAESGRESLPPTGLLVGSVTEGVAWIGLYKREMLDLTWPFDSDPAAPYPLYDRWTDTFNLSAEGSTFVQASSLAAAALRMARSPLAKQAWRAQPGRIEASKPLKSGEKIELKLVAEGLELSQAQIVWDAQDAAPVFGRTATYVPTDAGTHWVEAEAVLPDGRRVMAQVDLVIDR
ncbi:MAG: glycoside hydrolase family 9 protein, partial [Deltaproteobacteria bacterium]|nr:glycoside hydrolase family 9 protein [Deltaproteobacteria bacterium]